MYTIKLNMKLKLHNILKINNADIEIGGLTVITGENDSGKSSIGKILFSILKASNNTMQISRTTTIQKIAVSLRSIKRMFKGDPNILIFNNIELTSIELADKIFTYEDFVSSILEEAKHNEFNTRKTAILNNKLAQINQCIEDLRNPKTAFKRELGIITKSEFMEPLNSNGYHDSIILFHDDTTDAYGSDIKITLNDGKVSDVNICGNSSIEDITYIESPVYLHILDNLRNYRTSIYNKMIQGNIPYHLSDMAEKILSTSENNYSYDDFDNFQNLTEEISTIIEGDFNVNEKTKQLYFQRNGISIPTVSVASGIKSFGMLMRLIKTGNVSISKMLVLDEPEIHLHPEWQIRFCKLIIELVSRGVPIVVSSHSPYFIQGLRFFAAAKRIEKDVTYYMAEQNTHNELCNFYNVTNDLNRVFTLLAAPLQEIMNVDEARNNHNDTIRNIK